MLDRGFQMRDAEGKVIRLIGIASDITERKRLEGEVLAQRERLEREVLRRIEEEQERIGPDLHDGLCQSLVGAKYRIGVLEKLLTEKIVESAAAEAKEIEQMQMCIRDRLPPTVVAVRLIFVAYGLRNFHGR